MKGLTILVGVNDYDDSCLVLIGVQALDERVTFWSIVSRYRDAICSIIRRGEQKLITRV